MLGAHTVSEKPQLVFLRQIPLVSLLDQQDSGVQGASVIAHRDKVVDGLSGFRDQVSTPL